MFYDLLGQPGPKEETHMLIKCVERYFRPISQWTAPDVAMFRGNVATTKLASTFRRFFSTTTTGELRKLMPQQPYANLATTNFEPEGEHTIYKVSRH